MKYLILLLIAGGCAHSTFIKIDNTPIKLCRTAPDYTYILTDGIERGQRKYVGLSVEYWHQATGLFLFSYVWRDIKNASLDNILIYKVKDDGKVSSRELLVSNSRKCIVGAKIYIRDRYFEDTNVLQTIIRKELGYTMGLDSSPDFTNLMSSNLDLTLQHPIDANEETINAIHSTYSK